MPTSGPDSHRGRAGRDEVECSTDQLAMRPWEQLGRERTHRLWTLLK